MMIVWMYFILVIWHVIGFYSDFSIYRGKRAAFVDFFQAGLVYLRNLQAPMIASMFFNMIGIVVFSLEIIRIKMNGAITWMYIFTIIYILGHMYKDYIFYTYDWRKRKEKIKVYRLFYIVLGIILSITAYIRFYVLKL